jgi:hypothetical protein
MEREEIKLEYVSNLDRWFYVICGRHYSGKTKLAKKILEEKKPLFKVIFTNHFHEWETGDLYTRISSDLGEFEKSLGDWKKFYNIQSQKLRKRPEESCVIVVDNMRDTQNLVNQKFFRTLVSHSRHFNITIILTFDPEVQEDFTTNYLNMRPDVRIQVDAFFLSTPITDPRNDRRFYENYCASIETYTKYKAICKEVCKDNKFLVFSFQNLGWYDL